MHRIAGLKSLRFKLPAMTVTGTAVILVVLAAVSYVRMSDHLKNEATERLQVVAEQLAGLLEGSVEATERIALAESERPELQPLASPGPVAEADLRTAEEAALGFLRQRGLEDVQAYQIRRGDRCLVMAERSEGGPLSVDGGADRCLSGASIPPEERWAVSPFLMTDTELHFDISFRIGDIDGAGLPTVGTLRARADASDDVERLSRLISEDARFLLGTPGGLWSDLGSVQDFSADTLGMGVHEFQSDAGEPMLAAAVPVRGSPWVVWVERSVEGVVSPATDLLGELVLAVLVALGLIVGVTAVVTGRFIDPLRRMGRAAQDIARGELHRRVQMDRDDELGVVGAAFDSMAESVEESRLELEDRVRERTIELEQALTELKDIQQELIRKERLAILGELAGGVGHEIRTPLSVIQNSIYLIETHLEDPSPRVREYLDMMRTQIDHSISIITNLLEIGRVKPPRRQELQMRKFLRSVLNRIDIPATVEVDLRVAPDCPIGIGDISQIGQAVRNLVTNAVQAMDGEGRLTVEAAAHEDGVGVYVSDTGPGVTARMEERIFEPLVTTRTRGIGLGLSLSRTMVMNNGGELALEASSERGATFMFSLPRLQESPTPA